MWAFLQTPQPRANSSPVGGWTTWSGHSVPSSCLPLGPATSLNKEGEKKEEEDKCTCKTCDEMQKKAAGLSEKA